MFTVAARILDSDRRLSKPLVSKKSWLQAAVQSQIADIRSVLSLPDATRNRVSQGPENLPGFQDLRFWKSAAFSATAR